MFCVTTIKKAQLHLHLWSEDLVCWTFSRQKLLADSVSFKHFSLNKRFVIVFVFFYSQVSSYNYNFGHPFVPFILNYCKWDIVVSSRSIAKQKLTLFYSKWKFSTFSVTNNLHCIYATWHLCLKWYGTLPCLNNCDIFFIEINNKTMCNYLSSFFPYFVT